MDVLMNEEFVKSLLDPLNDAQRQGVLHVDGPMLILAGPGSGKTRVVTHRIAHLIAQGIPARQILALTFTNKAADEMRARLGRLVPNQYVWMGTFHRFCARLLRSYASLVGLGENFSIYDTDQSRGILRQAIDDMRIELTHVTPDRIANEISNAKNNLVGPDTYQAKFGNPVGGIVQQVYPKYQQALMQANAVDFDDLLLHVALMLRDNPELRRTLDERYRYILVDEYQDTNFAQYTIVRALSRDFPNLAVTGDPDQSIYGWRGANLNNILEFERDFPNVRVVRLEQNYRSTKRILRVADKLISNNIRRKQKSLFTENPEGEPVRLIVYPSSQDETDHIVSRIAEEIQTGTRRARDFAIFYRVNWLSRTIEQSLRSAGVPYQIVKGLEFYQRKEIKDVVAYLQLLNNPRDSVALRRIINTPPRKIGATTVSRLAEHADRRRISLLEAAREAGLVESLPKRSAAQVAAFVALFDRLNLMVDQPLKRLIETVLSETGYTEWLEASGDDEDLERLANLQELVSAASDFDHQHMGENHLEEFLEQVALVSDTDDWESASDRVSLMTLHAAKGLEFPVVFIIGVEQGLLPHERTREHPDEIEEERRLFFVGITRAEQELQISYAAHRIVQGNQRLRIASEFLLELPRDEMEMIVPRTVMSIPRPPVEDDPAYDDVSWDEEVYEVRTTPAADSRPPVVPTIMTAAQMLNANEEKKSSKVKEKEPHGKHPPEAYRPGMLVNHPSHGMGRITAISGIGDRRIASVEFFDPPRPGKFVLSHSPLEPIPPDQHPTDHV